MAAILNQVPERFTVLSGDDALTIPLIALGGRGIISVASNEIPAEMTQLAQACLKGDFETARRIQARYLPLMNVNFVESNPIPVKAAMALMGLLEPVWRLPLVPPQAASQSGQDRKGAGSGRPAGPNRPCCRADIEKLFDEKPETYTEEHFRLFQAFKDALNSGAVRAAEPDPSSPQRLARERLGQEGHPAGLPHGRHRRHVDRPPPPAVLRQGHLSR